MDNRQALTIILPCYNEAQNLKALLPGWVKFCRARGFKVILVDDGSRDDTRLFLKTFPAGSTLRVLHHKMNRGYGAAVKTGLREVQTRYTATMDADGQHDLRDIPRLLAVLRSGDADLVIGSRKGKASRRLFRSLGKWVIRLLARFLFYRKFADLNSGMRAFKTDLGRKYMGICPDSMAFCDIFVLTFLNQGHVVTEKDVIAAKRRGGSSSARIKTAFETVWEIIVIATLFKPRKIFLPLSAVLFLAGLGWGIPIVLAGRGVSIMASLLILMAIIFLVLGILAEQLSTLIRLKIDKAAEE